MTRVVFENFLGHNLGATNKTGLLSLSVPFCKITPTWHLVKTSSFASDAFLCKGAVYVIRQWTSLAPGISDQSVRQLTRLIRPTPTCALSLPCVVLFVTLRYGRRCRLHFTTLRLQQLSKPFALAVFLWEENVLPRVFPVRLIWIVFD
jgi:hypothetical protein